MSTTTQLCMSCFSRVPGHHCEAPDTCPCTSEHGVLATHPGGARRTDPDTSHLAAASIEHSMGRSKLRVLAAVATRGADGATAWQVGQILHQPNANRFNSRFNNLAEAGYIVDSGRRRPSGETGRLQIVWVVMQAGLDELRAVQERRRREANGS